MINSYYNTDDIEESITEVHHENEEPTVVNGYQEPGSYVRPIIYPVKEREQFDEFIARSYSCEQYIRYKCWNSRLLSDAGVYGYCFQRRLIFYYKSDSHRLLVSDNIQRTSLGVSWRHFAKWCHNCLLDFLDFSKL